MGAMIPKRLLTGGVEHNDLFEMGREGFRRCEPSHPAAHNDGLFQNRIRHLWVSR